MSFAHQIKTEICGNRPFRQRNKKAQAYGLLLFGKTFDYDSISLHTEHKNVARLYADSITDLVDIHDSITVSEVKRNDRRSIFVVTVDSLADRIAILSFWGCRMGQESCRIRRALLSEEELPAFLSGVFLACATISDPEKSYRVEFTISHKALCEDLEQLLTEMLSPPKATVRRNDYLLYYKESSHIEDLLTYVGAAKSALEIMEVKIVKGLRNRINRETNCETANISKTIDAAVGQIEDIQYIKENGGLILLPEELRELAQLRLENAELSLRELGEQLSTPLSRSGINHRLKRICAFAQSMRGKEGRSKGENI